MTSRRVPVGRCPSRWHLHGECGSSDALGLALLAPAALGLAVVILFLGRGVDSRATAHVAAESAAQAAARERSPAAARLAARSAARSMLVDDLTCADPAVEVDTSDFRPGGLVSVTVSCTPSTSGLDLIGAPSGGTANARAVARIDPLRAAERAP